MKKLTFLEIGAGPQGTLRYLLHRNWQDLDNASYASKLLNYKTFAPYAENQDVFWEGWFIEPIPEHICSLFRELEKVDIKSNFHIIQGAVEGSQSFKKFSVYQLRKHIDAPWMSSAIFAEKHPEDVDVQYKLDVFTFTLDTLFAHVGVEPDLVQLDVEFSERSVLENYRWSYYPKFWMIDVHFQKDTTDFIVNLLEEQGYYIHSTTAGTDSAEIHAELKGQAF